MMRFLLGVVALGMTGLLPAADRPNIVFVLIDDLRFDGLACTGHPFVQTPHADRLAREGATFTNAFVTTPLCSPSRASFLTGQYAYRHGVQNNMDNSALSRTLNTFPIHLQKAGYETAYIGKYHMGNDPQPRPGFDHWISFPGQGQYVDPMIYADGKLEKRTGYMTDILSDETVQFIRRPHEKPFFVYLSHKAVHGPFTPADRHADLYAEGEYPAPPVDDLSGKLALRTMRKINPKSTTPVGLGTMRQQMKCVASIDEGLGRILKALEDTNALEKTVVIFTSDNGFFWGDHGLSDKRWAYEPSIRIPFLIRYPKLIKSGSKIDPMILNVDVAPTVLELAGAPIPESVQGRSLVPLMFGHADGWRQEIFLEYFVDKPFPQFPAWHAVRTKRWKYITYPGQPDWDELYDLATDPNELTNRIADSSVATELATLKRTLARIGPPPGGQ